MTNLVTDSYCGIFTAITMKDIKELRKEMRMLRVEQQWLKAKALELKAYFASNKDKIKILKEEIQKSKPTRED